MLSTRFKILLFDVFQRQGGAVSRREGKAFRQVLDTPTGGYMSPSAGARFADAANGLALVMFREFAATP